MKPADLKNGDPIDLGVLGKGTVVGDARSVYPFKIVRLAVKVADEVVLLELPSRLEVAA